jgi:hypothetical protein
VVIRVTDSVPVLGKVVVLVVGTVGAIVVGQDLEVHVVVTRAFVVGAVVVVDTPVLVILVEDVCTAVGVVAFPVAHVVVVGNPATAVVVHVSVFGDSVVLIVLVSGSVDDLVVVGSSAWVVADIDVADILLVVDASVVVIQVVVVHS